MSQAIQQRTLSSSTQVPTAPVTPEPAVHQENPFARSFLTSALASNLPSLFVPLSEETLNQRLVLLAAAIFETRILTPPSSQQDSQSSRG